MKRSDVHGFQRADMHSFGGDSTVETPNQRALKPEYRVIRKYVKSKKQYWRERKRRKRIWQLAGKHTHKEVARMLGVSTKTVQRDLKKVRPYYSRLITHYRTELQRERDRDLNALLACKTPQQQLKLLTNMIIKHQKELAYREYRRHLIKITINMDNLTDGCPSLHVWPSLPISLMGTPYHIAFIVQRDGERIQLGRMTIREERRKRSLF